MPEPEWTRVRPSLEQKSVIVTDGQLMRESGDVQVDTTDIGASDHFLVWLPTPCGYRRSMLGCLLWQASIHRVGPSPHTKCFKKQKRKIRKWRLDRLVDEGVSVKYKEALKAEAFSESIRERVSEGMRGSGLVNAAIENSGPASVYLSFRGSSVISATRPLHGILFRSLPILLRPVEPRGTASVTYLESLEDAMYF